MVNPINENNISKNRIIFSTGRNVCLCELGQV